MPVGSGPSPSRVKRSAGYGTRRGPDKITDDGREHGALGFTV